MKSCLFIFFILFGAQVAFSQQHTSTKTSSETSSVSVSDDDTKYLLNATYNPAKLASVKVLIVEALGMSGEYSSGITIWALKDTYLISLKSNNLYIKLDKDKASGSLYRTIKKLGVGVQEILVKPAAAESKN